MCDWCCSSCDVWIFPCAEGCFLACADFFHPPIYLCIFLVLQSFELCAGSWVIGLSLKGTSGQHQGQLGRNGLIDSPSAFHRGTLWLRHYVFWGICSEAKFWVLEALCRLPFEPKEERQSKGPSPIKPFFLLKPQQRMWVSSTPCSPAKCACVGTPRSLPEDRLPSMPIRPELAAYDLARQQCEGDEMSQQLQWALPGFRHKGKITSFCQSENLFVWLMDGAQHKQRLSKIDWADKSKAAWIRCPRPTQCHRSPSSMCWGVR